MMNRIQQRIGLRGTLIALVLVPLLSIFSVGGFVVLNEVEQRVEERLHEDISLIARTLRGPLARSMERNRPVTVRHTLESTFDMGRVYGVYVYDSDGELVAQADRLAGRAEPELEGIDVSRAEDVGDYRSIGGREVYSYFTPITNAGGHVIGTLQVTRRASEIHDYLAAIRLNILLIIAFLGLMFVAVIMFAHHAVIGRPLQKLSRVMAHVALGDKDARTVPTGPREIQLLGMQFNSMLNDIGERDAALASERERQQRLEHKLRQAEKYALVGRLASGVAHELGTPLSVVDGHAQRLMRGKRPDSADHATLLHIRDAAARMASIVQQLLGFGRPSSRQPVAVSVSHVVSLAITDMRGQFEKAGTQLELQPGDATAKVIVDEERLREALVHLLRNALHAAGNAGRTCVGWNASVRGVEIFVEDSGIGIDEREARRIFEPFFTTKQPGEGSGLGLAIVKGIAADYGADVSVRPGEIGGARFSIEFQSHD